MRPSTIQQLITLNHTFYERFAHPFSQTRSRLQPGVRRLMSCLLQAASLLDFGCGNGELYFVLRQADFRGRYLGLDFSYSLLQIATQRWTESKQRNVHEVPFQSVDITQPNWENSLQGETFSAITAFAVLHHLPSFELRLQVLKTLGTHLQRSEEAALYLSNWQFLNSPRYRQRIQPWEEVGLTASEVEDGDYLLDWREGGRGLRYVHHFSEEELAQLAKLSGFSIVKTFYSDGREGDLAIYQVWSKVGNAPTPV